MTPLARTPSSSALTPSSLTPASLAPAQLIAPPPRRSSPLARRRGRLGSDPDAVAAAASSARALFERELTALRELRAVHARLSEMRIQHARVKAAGLLALEGARAAAAVAPTRADRQEWLGAAARVTSLRQAHLMQERDELGALLPNAVRIGTRAASGPHQAGMHGDPDDLARERLSEPRYGVDVVALLARGRERDAIAAASARSAGAIRSRARRGAIAASPVGASIVGASAAGAGSGGAGSDGASSDGASVDETAHGRSVQLPGAAPTVVAPRGAADDSDVAAVPAYEPTQTTA